MRVTSYLVPRTNISRKKAARTASTSVKLVARCVTWPRRAANNTSSLDQQNAILGLVEL